MKAVLVSVWIGLGVALVLFGGFGYGSLEDVIGTRFDLNGGVLVYGNKALLFFFLGLLALIVEALLLFLYVWIDRIPRVMVNVPNIEEWLASESLEKEMFRRVRLFVAGLGALVTLTLLNVLNLVLYLNKSTISVYTSPGLVAVIALVAFTALIAWSLTLFRLPK